MTSVRAHQHKGRRPGAPSPKRIVFRAMKDALLALDPSYDAATQSSIAYMAASLDDQLEKLKERVAGLTPAQLEFQTAPGFNTIGMLMAHNAIAEAFWILAAPVGMSAREDIDDTLFDAIGIRTADDGMPIPADGGHPESLKDWELPQYLAVLDRARAHTHSVLHTWTDASLDDIHIVRGVKKSRRWILYHILEHFIGHYGQVRLLARQCR